jgi:uncharacterized membrane protein
MQKGTFELIAAKEQELNTEREYAEAWRDYWIARAELEKAVGGWPDHNKKRSPMRNRHLKSNLNKTMSTWFWYAVGAALLYGLHQIFTKLASAHIGDGLGGFVVEATAAVTIFGYLVYLRFWGKWNQPFSGIGIWYSALTGVCVGFGTILFFVLFQKAGPLSAVPVILAGGAALMAIAGIVFFHEPASWPRFLGIVFAIAGLLLMRK